MDVREMDKEPKIPKVDGEARAKWNSRTEFLMSCIAFSVGLGNIWRFSYTAYENGGGAFLLPYVVVLVAIGKPLYYMEMLIGQFSSRSSIQVWSIAPALKGIGIGIIVAVFSVTTYYCFLIALSLFYLISSFQSVLPWSVCREEWADTCFSSSVNINGTVNSTQSSSSELYFLKVVLNEIDDISNGLGTPSWKLILCLAVSWVIVVLVVWRGIKSSGKASYFLALFPYTVLIVLFVRAVTLPGAVNGIIFLYKPDWTKVFSSQVWYAAVTQAFFSLGISSGAIIVYSSYNNFDHNVRRDCIIVTTLDLFTSLLAGTTVFSILGNLAFELDTDDINSVVRSGTGLAFISYPEALTKFSTAPQLFAVLFFLMLFVLGIGTAVAFSNVVISVIIDRLPKLKQWVVAMGVAGTGFLIGITYCTPGGQHILYLVDYFAGTFTIISMAIFEVVGVSWIYGVDRLLDDVEFMTGKRPSMYWRFCWSPLAPLMLIAIFVYFLVNLTPLTYNDQEYPTLVYAVGWTLFFFGVVQLPVWIIVTKIQNRKMSWFQIFRPAEEWGPKEPSTKIKWKEFKETKQRDSERNLGTNRAKFMALLFGK